MREVPVKPLEPIRQGDVLFTIDPESYQAEVDRLEAALKEAQQAARMLPADVVPICTIMGQIAQRTDP